ncbi:ABC transporter permease subunit [Salinibius halmophilus]|uniref:ABC transporter permease subunit n=1 Tax=Salinibius halmophilus TaxID=1853216 RepID=UPI000E66E483|nr:ABC transporter permease subunit [Salinibius halmophilus]
MKRWSRRAIVSVPYFWLGLFLLVPLLLVIKVAFAEAARAIPPFSSLTEFEDGILAIRISINSFAVLFEDTMYLQAFFNSVVIAAGATLLCLLIGYPMAYAIARAPAHQQSILLMLVLLPSWTSFLIRVYAWMTILGQNGPLNNFLISIGLISEPLEILNTNLAVYIGIVYSYLPFMVLPLYANLVKHDLRLIEAAQDLGARGLTTFTRITLPLSKNGIIAGSMLVFIPAVGEYVIPELLGGSDTLVIGKVVWQEFFNNRDWPVASALALLLVLALLAPIVWFQRNQDAVR